MIEDNKIDWECKQKWVYSLRDFCSVFSDTVLHSYSFNGWIMFT